MDNNTLLQLWGKSDKNDPHNYHPLLFHLLDVGYAARALWRTGLPSSMRTRLAEALSLAETDAERVCVLLAAQHDLGKASAFQFKSSVPFLPDQVCAAGLQINNSDEQPHGYVTARALPFLAARGIGGWQAADESTRNRLARIVGGHHGTFPSQLELKNINVGATLGGAIWDEARRALLERVQQALYPDTEPVGLPELNRAALVPLVGGFVSITDWIGSSKDHFPPAGPMPLSDYQSRAQGQAEKAIGEFGWSPLPRFAPPATFGEIFRDSEGNPLQPNPMQSQVVTWADAAARPYLLIVEAAMGEGKTEAALYAIDRALSVGLATGFFIALPTQATGNAMFHRVLKDYFGNEKRKHGGRLNFQLVHAGSFVSDVFDTLKLEAIFGGPHNEDDRVVAYSWFTPRKQALLAPFGVGTIDQSLLGVLQTRHWFVRLFGLAGKIVVFDEIHSYDVYMSTLLARLLGWLRVLGCTVILLSATLPQSKRQELVRAWDPSADVPEAAYPRMTFVGDGRPQAAHVPGVTAAPKKVHVSFAAPDLSAFTARIPADLPRGGCAVIICNTVDRAQEAYCLLSKALGPDGWEVTLFHAQTIARWRNDREKQVLAAFGKEGQRPPKAVLVATSVVEQSLDLDFDWMASEMPPIDLLLQRVGRLWRHPRPARTEVVDRANLVVICGQGEEGMPLFPPHTDVIYDRWVLLRSWLALNSCQGVLALPDEIERLVRAVYDEPEPAGLSAGWQAALADAALKRETQAARDTETAKKILVNRPDKGAEHVLNIGSATGEVRLDLHEEEDPKIHKTLRAATRLGDPRISVICTGTDANGERLAEGPGQPPDAAAARAQLAFSLSIQNHALYEALSAEPAPPAWKDSPFLRWHRVLRFDHGVASLAGRRLHLSRELGLEIKKETKAKGFEPALEALSPTP